MNGSAATVDWQRQCSACNDLQERRHSLIHHCSDACSTHRSLPFLGRRVNARARYIAVVGCRSLQTLCHQPVVGAKVRRPGITFRRDGRAAVFSSLRKKCASGRSLLHCVYTCCVRKGTRGTRRHRPPFTNSDDFCRQFVFIDGVFAISCNESVTRPLLFCRASIDTMVQRLTYRRRTPYNTKSNKTKVSKTPGGRLVFLKRKKRGSVPKCGDTGVTLKGVSAVITGELRAVLLILMQIRPARPQHLSKMTKRLKTVSRTYGGVLSAHAVKDRCV